MRLKLSISLFLASLLSGCGFNPVVTIWNNTGADIVVSMNQESHEISNGNKWTGSYRSSDGKMIVSMHGESYWYPIQYSPYPRAEFIGPIPYWYQIEPDLRLYGVSDRVERVGMDLSNRGSALPILQPTKIESNNSSGNVD